MSLSKECYEYHLTHCGWVDGSFKGDVLSGSKEVEIPNDRVLTVACYDDTPAAFSKTYFYDKVVWESEDKDLWRRGAFFILLDRRNQQEKTNQNHSRTRISCISDKRDQLAYCA